MADPIPSCLGGGGGGAAQTSANSNLTTSFYHTTHGLAVLTWSRTLLTNALSIDIHIQESTASFRLRLTPWLFWKKKGSEASHLSRATIEFHWDLSRAKFHSGPEPHSGFFVAVTYNRQMLLLLGDSHHAAYSKTQSARLPKQPQLVMRREHVFGRRSYATRAVIAGQPREILIECGGRDESRLSISIGGKRVLQVKRLRWKFRGNEKIIYDGVPVQVSWDVYNWLFDYEGGGEDDDDHRHAVFIFRFENELGEEEECCGEKGLGAWKVFGLGLEGLEREKMKMKRKKSLLKTISSSSLSSSSLSSGSSSSVMEWASSEESEMQIAGGFSLLVYAWRR
ncbi:hypothetical protein ACLOJK_028435 [Asimina triloba]